VQRLVSRTLLAILAVAGLAQLAHVSKRGLHITDIRAA
jgi:hypothetical protein